MINIAQKIEDYGITLDAPPPPAAAYLPYKIHNNIVYISGQLPMDKGVLQYAGSCPHNVTQDDAYLAARLCAVNILRQLNQAINGDWSLVDHVIKLGGFVQCDADFTGHPEVINGASNLMADIFGDAGQHVRFAVGTHSLPRNAAVEIEAMIALK